jgi:hypothetical protein
MHGVRGVLIARKLSIGQPTTVNPPPGKTQDLMPSGADPSPTNQQVDPLQAGRGKHQSSKDDGLGEFVEPLAT